ncbi:peptide ABC transporter permease [Devriesea agamarum]|uniref:peptide ABC transporter permease n=1 Tax=Devriesea agamarum TaxID=472569 RepID=UPI0012ECF685|nr:peptide ABC transporter permease [Devriesea agamarum]
MANYLTFSSASTIYSTLKGRQEIADLYGDGTFISNLDPDSPMSYGHTPPKAFQDVYDYLNEHYNYAFYTDGYMVKLPNSNGVEVPVSYMNKRYNDLNGFVVSDGKTLRFDYDLGKNETIPVLVGKGLSKDYPIGSRFKIHDPALGREVTLKVEGVITQNASHSNPYLLNSKQYYNFSIAIPVTENFIKQSNYGLKVNGLSDLILMDADRASVTRLGTYIEKSINEKYNFFNQQQNDDFYNEYFISSMKFLIGMTSVLLALIIGLSVWSSLVSVRVMSRDFTINLLVGLSYTKIRRLFYSYYATLSALALLATFALTAYSRYTHWRDKEAFFMTYGFAGLIKMDWLALLVVLLFNICLLFVVVEIIMWRLKRIPVSVGVLQ